MPPDDDDFLGLGEVPSQPSEPDQEADSTDWDTLYEDLSGEELTPENVVPGEQPDDFGLLSQTPQDTILQLVERYEQEANSSEVVQRHLPTLFVVAAAKVATKRNAKEPIYFRSAGVPYRFLLHMVLVGPSGSGKGETVQQFQWIIEARDSLLGPDQPIWGFRNFQGGRAQGLRGGHTTNNGERERVVGLIEEMDDGFVHVPEFTVLANKRKTEDGSVQEIVAGMDTGDYDFMTIAGGGRYAYHSDCGLLVDLQTAKLDDAEALVIGWNRRAIYEKFFPRGPSKEEPAARTQVVAGNLEILGSLRSALRRLKQEWKPTTFDWTEVDDWLRKAYDNYKATPVDEQLVRTLTLGYHMISTYEWSGTVRIRVTPLMESFLRNRILWRNQARSPPEQRGAQDAFHVLEDPKVLGTKGRQLKAPDVISIVARYLSVSEEQAETYVRRLLVPNKTAGVQWLLKHEAPSPVGEGMIDMLELNPTVLDVYRRARPDQA